MNKNNFNTEEYYQAKYNFFKVLAFWTTIVGCLAMITYFVSDCQLFHRFAYETLVPRVIGLVPMVIYILISRKVKTYKIMIPLSYFVSHLIMWNTIWAIYYLPDRTHASEGFIIMNFLFFAIGFAAPFQYHVIAHALVIVNILASTSFNHYENLDIMISLNVPLLIGTCAVVFFMDRLYRVHYKTMQQLQQISLFDNLTGVYNRNVITKMTSEDKENKKLDKRFGKTTGVVMFDIDFFKSVNDKYGHLQGDIVLKEVCGCIKKTLVENDLFIRWGGEEFVLLLADYSAERTRQYAEMIRKMIERQDNGVTKVTISLGVAMYDGTDYKQAIDAADKALYEAKNNGRNCVKVSI